MWIINEWNAIYETGESRRYKKLGRWIAIPNRHDGKGYKRLIRRPGGLEAFACFILMVQCASRTATRGVLAGPEGPYTALDLEDATFVPAEAFERAFELLSAPEIGWISDVDELPANWPSPERIPLTTRAATHPARGVSRAASLPDNSEVFEPSAQNGHVSAQNDPESAQNGHFHAVPPPVDFAQTNKQTVRADKKRASYAQVHDHQAVENEENITPETLARMAEEFENGLLTVTPAPRKRPGAKPSRNEVTRMAQALQTYAQHLTHRPWPLPDWPLALKACGICHPNYTQAEEALRTSALAKRPRGSNNRVDMQTYGLPITILESAFSKRSQ